MLCEWVSLEHILDVGLTYYMLYTIVILDDVQPERIPLMERSTTLYWLDVHYCLSTIPFSDMIVSLHLSFPLCHYTLAQLVKRLEH